MAYNESLASRIRLELAHLPNVNERKMFGGLAFIVNSKMCLTAGFDRMMCRIHPENHKSAIEKKGCQTVIMRGRKYKGYVYVSIDSLNKKLIFLTGLHLL